MQLYPAIDMLDGNAVRTAIMPGPTQPAPALNPYPGTAADGSRPSGLHCQPACGTRQCPATECPYSPPPSKNPLPLVP